MKQQQRRATFEDVSQAQDKLLKIVDRCIQEKRCLKKSERKNFFRKYRWATLGVDSKMNINIQGEKKSYNLGHVGHAAYWLAYQQQNVVSMGDEQIEIQVFWKKLRDKLFYIFPVALRMAVKMSKEQTRFGPAEAAKV